jgi:AbrB family looped-hinge helix DNA binding protein
MQTLRINTRGQITIPAELRKRLGIRIGTRITLTEEGARLVMTPIERLLDEIQGFLKPRPGETSAFEMHFEERKRERMRENSER